MMSEVDVPVASVEEYVANLPPDRRDAIARVRDVVNANIPKGYEERFQYGMICWCVPESVLAAEDVYNKQPLALASLGSQKSHMALYLMSIYGDEKERLWFESAFKKTGKKLNMAKSCVRFSSLDALPLDVIGEAMSHVPVEKYVAAYHASRAMSAGGREAAAKADAAKAKVEAAKQNSRSAANAIAARRATPVASAPASKSSTSGKPVAKPTAAGKTSSAAKVAKKPAKKSR